MPQIFDEAGREKVKNLLLDNGFELIKRHGLKKTSISDVTKKAGIATGTFYNFFKNKEEFVYQIVLYKRNISKELFSKLSSDGKMDKEAFRKYIITLYASDNNIFEYLDDSEISQLKARWPEEYWRDGTNDQDTIMHILKTLKNPRPDCDWQIIGNLFKSIALIGHGKNQLYIDKYEETIEILADSIIRYIFG